MSKYISIKSIREDLGIMYRDGLNKIAMQLSKLGYQAIKHAYEEGHTDKPKKYEDVPVIRDGDFQYYRYDIKDKNGEIVHRAGEMKMRKAPIPDGKWRNQTYNLQDSFGCAVYVAGHLVKDSVKFLKRQYSKTNDPTLAIRGRQRLQMFFEESHYGKASGDIVLICVAAMYYSRYLERGQHRGGYRIRVVSGARDYIDRHWTEYLDKKYKSIVMRGTSLLSDEGLQRRFEQARRRGGRKK